LHEQDANRAGFQWVDCHDAEQSTLSWLRLGAKPEDVILIVCNFTPQPRQNLRVGAPRGGFWKELFNSDAHDYGGSGLGNFGGVEAAPLPWHNQSHSLTISLPPLGAVVFKPASGGLA
jgi:1,4-alpha-glucan branching enzyme